MFLVGKGNIHIYYEFSEEIDRSDFTPPILVPKKHVFRLQKKATCFFFLFV